MKCELFQYNAGQHVVFLSTSAPHPQQNVDVDSSKVDPVAQQFVLG